MYWAKLSKATAIKTYESQTGSNINWWVHGITNRKKRLCALVTTKSRVYNVVLLFWQVHGNTETIKHGLDNAYSI